LAPPRKTGIAGAPRGRIGNIPAAKNLGGARRRGFFARGGEKRRGGGKKWWGVRGGTLTGAARGCDGGQC